MPHSEEKFFPVGSSTYNQKLIWGKPIKAPFRLGAHIRALKWMYIQTCPELKVFINNKKVLTIKKSVTNFELVLEQLAGLRCRLNLHQGGEDKTLCWTGLTPAPWDIIPASMPALQYRHVGTPRDGINLCQRPSSGVFTCRSVRLSKPCQYRVKFRS